MPLSLMYKMRWKLNMWNITHMLIMDHLISTDQSIWKATFEAENMDFIKKISAFHSNSIKKEAENMKGKANYRLRILSDYSCSQELPLVQYSTTNKKAQ